jgi:hypothetical protein
MPTAATSRLLRERAECANVPAMRTMAPVRKALRARDIPPSWQADLPDDPEAPVTVWIGLAEESPARPLVDFIGSGKGVHRTRAEADAHIGALRDEWQG